LRSSFSPMDDVNCVIRGAIRKNASCYVIIGSLLLLLKTHLYYLFIHFSTFYLILVSVSLETLVSRACQSLSPWRHFFMYFNWYLCCGFISYLNFFFPFDFSVSYTYLLIGALQFAKVVCDFFLCFDIPLRSTETPHLCCTRVSAKVKKKNKKYIVWSYSIAIQILNKSVIEQTVVYLTSDGHDVLCID
jgi:hypothetical protein